ncbi:MAG: SMP-30/gluconolactonase/LRE family protein [Eubacteriales bacterium]|nr:SMP-30/gluconolactonase/LRE family protein [Eubacteriales bacterium]
MKTTKLFMKLPDYICTPDSLAVAANGELVLSCPNYADESLPGCIVRIDKNRKIRKWFDVEPLPETGHARPMGIAFDERENLWICDNQAWLPNPAYKFKGRILRVTPEGKTVTVAYGMEHPNGMRIRNGYAYVTQSLMEKVADPSGLMVSAVYRFAIDEENVAVTNTLADKNIIATFLTYNPECQYGLDGIEFDHEGNLLVGNFGDGTIHRIRFNPDQSVKDISLYAADPKNLYTTDGMVMDEKGNLYIADFSANAIGMVRPDGTVERIAESPDSDGFGGELDQPSEAGIWNGLLVIPCFDTAVGGIHKNTKHEMPATIACLELD